MNRRESIKAIGITTLGGGLLLEACNDKAAGEPLAVKASDLQGGRQAFEIERDRALKSETFFTQHETETIAVLVDIIIPADEHSGSATDAKVPAFIEFI